MADQQYYHIICRHGNEAEWIANNPVLHVGEISWVADKQYVKFGDGITLWSLLPKFQGGSGGGSDILGNIIHLASATNFAENVFESFYVTPDNTFIYGSVLRILNTSGYDAILSLQIRDDELNNLDSEYIYENIIIPPGDSIVIEDLSLRNNQTISLKTNNKDIIATFFGQSTTIDTLHARRVSLEFSGLIPINAYTAEENCYQSHFSILNRNNNDIIVNIFLSENTTLLSENLIINKTLASNELFITEDFYIPKGYNVFVQSSDSNTIFQLWSKFDV